MQKCTRTKEIFVNWVGSWIIRRVLGNFGTGSGIAKFSFVDGEQESGPSSLRVLDYREDLKVKYNNCTSTEDEGDRTAWQEYTYTYDEDGDKITKKFSDGRLFYDVSFGPEGLSSTVRAQGEHLCDRDLYSGKYDFRGKDHFVLTYEVKGPQKDYVIVTEYFKVKAPGDS